jgi:hypothetical protein
MRAFPAAVLVAFMLAGAAVATPTPQKFGNAKRGKKLFIVNDWAHLSDGGGKPALPVRQRAGPSIRRKDLYRDRQNITDGGEGDDGLQEDLTTARNLIIGVRVQDCADYR